jgi:pyruvate,water dikinase
MPADLAAAIQAAYQTLGQPPVAVRSSATAEDLPELSFAGQQDTFLNITTPQALLQAVIQCWSSLWTERAIGYRQRNALPQTGLALAVIVQQMVQSAASGVLFTANPLSGLRREVVIDATLGLGEALVSGQVEPDHYVVDCPSGRPAQITHKRLGAKAVATRSQPGGGVATQPVAGDQTQALPDAQILTLAALGRRVADDYGLPQDIEWAWAAGQLYLLQSRPITSLYPLPASLPPDDGLSPLTVLASFGAVQGMLDPMTPLGQDGIALLGAAVPRLMGLNIPPERQAVFLSAGERLFVNISRLVRNQLGWRGLLGALGFIELPTQQLLKQLQDDPRLAVGQGRPRLRTFGRLALFLLPILPRAIINILRPEQAHVAAFRASDQFIARYRQQGQAARILAEQLALLRLILARAPYLIVHRLLPVFPSGIGMFYQLRRLAQAVPNGERLAMEVTRGLPHNVTTEMDLKLWAVAQTIRRDPAAAQHFARAGAAELAAAYRVGQLPAAAQAALQSFLELYGDRGLAEIDMGRPSWNDDPAPVFQALLSYLNITDPQQAPDRVFERGAQAAQAAIEAICVGLRQQPHGARKVRLARFMARRVRALAGLRELPKFTAVRLMNVSLSAIQRSGQDLVAAGHLSRPDDIFFFHVVEMDELAAQQAADGRWPAAPRLRAFLGQSLAGLVAERRALYAREQRRRQVPRLILGDGRTFYEGLAAPIAGADQLTGDPVSPGVVEGRVRVVLDPHTAQLQPGEILVCPGTDPSWTPLFLAAAGLVMEVGGMMTHGSVVAREYGLPAVVGVDQATHRLVTGQRIRLDGSSGLITLLPDPPHA